MPRTWPQTGSRPLGELRTARARISACKRAACQGYDYQQLKTYAQPAANLRGELGLVGLLNCGVCLGWHEGEFVVVILAMNLQLFLRMAAGLARRCCGFRKGFAAVSSSRVGEPVASTTNRIIRAGWKQEFLGSGPRPCQSSASPRNATLECASDADALRCGMDEPNAPAPGWLRSSFWIFSFCFCHRFDFGCEYDLFWSIGSTAPAGSPVSANSKVMGSSTTQEPL